MAEFGDGGFAADSNTQTFVKTWWTSPAQWYHWVYQSQNPRQRGYPVWPAVSDFCGENRGRMATLSQMTVPRKNPTMWLVFLPQGSITKAFSNSLISTTATRCSAASFNAPLHPWTVNWHKKCSHTNHLCPKKFKEGPATSSSFAHRAASCPASLTWDLNVFLWKHLEKKKKEKEGRKERQNSGKLWKCIFGVNLFTMYQGSEIKSRNCQNRFYVLKVKLMLSLILIGTSSFWSTIWSELWISDLNLSYFSHELEAGHKSLSDLWQVQILVLVFYNFVMCKSLWLGFLISQS